MSQIEIVQQTMHKKTTRELCVSGERCVKVLAMVFR